MRTTPFTPGSAKVLTLASIGALFALLMGCSTGSILVGNVKPVDQKDRAHYSILDLGQNPKWKKLDTGATFSSDEMDASTDAFSSEAADDAFQHVDTGAVISLNSTCRANRKEAKNLEPYLKELLLGFTHVVKTEDKKVTVAEHEAIQRTIQGTISGEKTKIRAIVLSREHCVYDLIYIARPDKFDLHVEDFTAFVSSLKLR